MGELRKIKADDHNYRNKMKYADKRRNQIWEYGHGFNRLIGYGR